MKTLADLVRKRGRLVPKLLAAELLARRGEGPLARLPWPPGGPPPKRGAPPMRGGAPPVRGGGAQGPSSTARTAGGGVEPQGAGAPADGNVEAATHPEEPAR